MTLVYPYRDFVPDAQLVDSFRMGSSLLKHPVPHDQLPDYLKRPFTMTPREDHEWRYAFLRVLHPTGYRDLRAFRKGEAAQTFSFHSNNLGGVDEFAALYRDRDVYVGVAPRVDDKSRGTDACVELHALFADIDFKDSTEAEARTRLAAFPLMPSAVVASGGGLQVYWLLKEAVDLTNGRAAFAKQLLRALATALGADLSAAEPARILRLPGSLNHKYDPPRLVVVEALSEHRRYTLADLLAILPPVPEKHEQSNASISHGLGRDVRMRLAQIWLERQPGAKEGEHGHEHSYKVACAVAHDHDLSEDDAFEVMRDWNQRCDPPWEEHGLRKLIRDAAKYAKGVRGEKLLVVLDPNDPLPSARMFVAIRHTADDVLTLRRQAGVFYGYESQVAAYHERADATIRADLYEFLEAAKVRDEDGLFPFRPTKSKVSNVADALYAVANLDPSIAAPCWLANDPGLSALDILACPNGLLHIPTRTLLPATPHFFTLNGLDFDYRADTPQPTHWFTFLKQLWPDDVQSVQALQELFGYVLTPDTRFQKIGLIVGPKRGGKGVIGRVLRSLVGDRNTCSPTLASFGDQFGKQVLIGKTLAIIADARLGNRIDTASVAEALLSISGEDPQTVQRKFLPDWNGKLSSRFLLLANELPRINDVSGALAGRFVILVLKHSFYGREDLGLYDRLTTELPSILNWALEGRDRLYARGWFVQPRSADDLIEELADLNSPESAMLRECTETKVGAWIEQAQLFRAWQLWCSINGRDQPGTTQTYARNVRTAVPWIGVKRHGPKGEQERCWEGLRLTEVWVKKLEPRMSEM
jgi:putative DNA primase/helicase